MSTWPLVVLISLMEFLGVLSVILFVSSLSELLESSSLESFLDLLLIAIKADKIVTTPIIGNPIYGFSKANRAKHRAAIIAAKIAIK
jgi:hypothetical protein